MWEMITKIVKPIVYKWGNTYYRYNGVLAMIYTYIYIYNWLFVSPVEISWNASFAYVLMTVLSNLHYMDRKIYDYQWNVKFDGTTSNCWQVTEAQNAFPAVADNYSIWGKFNISHVIETRTLWSRVVKAIETIIAIRWWYYHHYFASY